MNRRDLRKLYDVRMEIDPKTGKDVKRAYYIGKYYALDVAEKKRVTPLLWALWAAMAAAFLTGGCTVNMASRCVWVMPFYVSCLLPLFYLGTALWRMRGLKETIDQVQKADVLDSAAHAGLGLAVLGGLWTAGDVVFLLVSSWVSLGMELLFLLCAVITAAGGFATQRVMKRLDVRE